jgi:hypothetical protein
LGLQKKVKASALCAETITSNESLIKRLGMPLGIHKPAAASRDFSISRFRASSFLAAGSSAQQSRRRLFPNS